MAAVVIADDPDSSAPPPGQVTDLADPRSLLKAETVQEHDSRLGVGGSLVSHRQAHTVADGNDPFGGRGGPTSAVLSARAATHEPWRARRHRDAECRGCCSHDGIVTDLVLAPESSGRQISLLMGKGFLSAGSALQA